MIVALGRAAGASAQVESDELPPGVFPVLTGDGPQVVVIRVGAPDDWGRGRLRLTQREYPTVVTRAVRLHALPREVRADARGTVVLSDQGRSLCRARLGRPRLLRHVTPDFDYPIWNGEGGPPRLTDAQVAQRAWDMVDRSLLVAPVLRVSGDCRRAQWASRDQPDFATPTAADAEVLEAFRSLEDYAWLAEAWGEASEYDDDPSATRWDARSGGAYRRAFDLTTAGRRYVLVTAQAHAGCGDFTGTLWALFERTASGVSLVVSEHASSTPSGLADFDHDGTPEILSFRRVTSVALGQAVDVGAPFLGCPC